MNSTPRKTGRPRKPYVASDGTVINGLRRKADGRWVLVDTGETFREPDERLALARFRRLRGEGTAVVALPAFAFEPGVPAGTNGNVHESFGLGSMADLSATAVRFVDQDALWSYFRQELHSRPQWVAQRVGVEQIGYLSELRKPEPSPTLKQVGDLYAAKAVTSHWAGKCKLAWREFTSCAGVDLLRHVTQEHVTQFEEDVLSRMRAAKSAPTFARHRFQAVKSILAYPPKRGKWAEDCRRVLAYAAVLVPPRSSSVDPCPISRQDFSTLLTAADDAMKAILLVALNCCMYDGEVAALQWDELDMTRGTLVAKRPKTRVVRIAVLWPETIEALRKIAATPGPVFRTGGTRMQHNGKSIYNEWYRKLLPTCRGNNLHLSKNVQFAHIRDGAYTAAVEAGVPLDVCKLLAGHSTGISDHYVKRRPEMVAAACDAIRRAYIGSP